MGALLSSSPVAIKRYIGLALTPQAGVAIGLIFLINNDPVGSNFSSLITPVVLAGVLLSEIFGPIFAKLAIKLAGELPPPVPTKSKTASQPFSKTQNASIPSTEPKGVPLVPWIWPKLPRPARAEGVVVFGVSHLATGAALARITTIFANYHQAYPLVAHIIPPDNYDAEHQERDKMLLAAIKNEVHEMGSELYTVTKQSNDVAQGILDVARQSQTRGIVLGHSSIDSVAFQKIIGQIVENAPCPSMVIKFSGIFHTERILVPFVNTWELELIKTPLKAMAAVGRHQITLLRLLSSSDTEKNVLKTQEQLINWAANEHLSPITTCQALTTEARKETILTEAANHDLIIMAGPRPQAFPQRLMFGSLHAAVIQDCDKTLITVYPAADEGEG